MALAYRSSTTQGGATGLGLTVTKPAGTVDGDIVVIIAYTALATITWTNSGSFTTLWDEKNSGTEPLSLTAWAKRISGDGASWTFTPSASVWRRIIAYCISGNTGVATFIDVSDSDQGDASTTVVAPSVVTTAANTMIVAAGVNFDGATPSSTTGMITSIQVNYGGVVVGHAPKATAGATGTTTWTIATAENWAAGHIAILENDAGGSATITPALYTDTDTFHAATIGRGAVTITPALYTDPDTTPAATIGRGAVTVTPALYTDPDTTPAATIGRGAVSITPALYTDPDTSHAATIGIAGGPTTITPALYTDPDTSHAATIGRGAVSVAPALYVDPDTAHSATVTAGSITVAAALYTDTDTFYGSLASTGGVQIAPALYEDADVSYAATIAPGAVTITPARYTNVSTTYGALVFIPGALVPGAITIGQGSGIGITIRNAAGTTITAGTPEGF